MKKNLLIEKLLSVPLKFDDNDFNAFINFYKGTDGSLNTTKGFDDLRYCVRKIYDLNENNLLKTSNANGGILGRLNRRSTKTRQKTYFRKIGRQKANKKYIRIYAEGDSWFLFPTFVKDIIDWLSKNDHYLIYSDAYGGDWITNIIYEGQYIEGLTTHSPDIFLVSGGGNDLVGNSRMAVMVSLSDDQDRKYENADQLWNQGLTEFEKEMILLSQPCITKEFYSFVLVMKAQYYLLFKQLYSDKSKHKDIISITHGYAYPYPKKGRNFSLRYPLQPVVNSFLKSGQWLFRPLMIKGIIDKKLQRPIVMTFIYEFNEMLQSVSKDFENVYHIDCRKIPRSQQDWYDELHLKSNIYKKVAQQYQKIIDDKV